MSRVWSKFDEKGLARFVVPDAIRWVRLPVNRADLMRHSDGRRRLVEAIYTVLLERQIRYAPERYHPELAEQVIRSPSEILASPGEGTCLDLAVLFGGLCLGFELLPVVVVTDTHALCVVSLTHGSPDWDAFDRRERQSFEEPVTDPELLRGMVAGGAYLAVECTGFAHSESLPDSTPEGRGRQNGRLTFASAAQAGEEQLERSDSPLRFAIDVAVAHYHWNLAPPELPPDHLIATEELVATEVAAGLRLERAQHQPVVRPYPRPVAPLLRPIEKLVDRQADLGAIQTALEGDEVASLGGAQGIGKTAVLRALAFESPVEYPDGVVYLRGVTDPGDGAQSLFESFFDTDPGFKPSEVRTGQALRDLRVLVLVDDVAVGSVEALRDLMPHAGFVAVPSSGSLGQGRPITLAGLDPPDATELVVDHLGREFGSAEKEQVLALAAQLQGHPGRLIDAARAVREGTATFEGLLAESTAAAAAAAGRTRLSGFTPGERKIVELLAAFKASGLDRSHIEALVGEEAAQALRDLVTKRVVVSSSPRYRLDATSIGEVIEETDLQRNRVRATEHFVQWAATADPDDLARSAPELLHSLESARLDHDWPTVLALGTALEAPLAATRRWGAWASVLEAIIEGARRLGDTAAEAKALHQLGTRALLRGDRRVARSLLREARRTSKRLGDQAGAALSGHNLSLAGPWWLAPWVVVVAILGGLAGAVATVCVVSEVCVGAVAMIEAEPTELAFREVSLRQGRTERVILANTSDASERVGPASIEGDDAFQVVTEDCPEVLRPAGVCALVVSFTPDEPGDYAGTLVVPLAGGDPIRVPLSGNALTPGELRAMPERVDFGSVFEGRAEERVLTVTNVGEETAMLSQPPAVDGRYFTLGANDCLDSVEPHASCEITVVFEPKRIGDQGVQGGVASGTLTIGWDQDGHAVIPIEGVSIALPDLAIELTEAEPIGRTLLFGPPGGLAQFSTDVVVIRVIAGVGNTGLVAAGEFLIAAEWFSEEQGQWLPAQLGAEPATASDHVAFVGSEPESSAEFRGFVVIPRGLLDPALPLRIRLIVDHCEGVAAEAAECDIVEADEANNVSVEVEANPVVAISTVPLQVSQHRLLSQETNSADLVADALLDYARRLAEEQGLEAPTAAILDVPSMLPPGRPPELFLIGDAFVGPRDLRVLHLVDLVPVGEPVLLLEAEWEAVIARFLNAVTGGVPSDRFLQISAGSLFEWCANEDTAIAILTLGGDQLIPAESNSPLILATTRTLAEEIGGKQIGEPVTLAEILRDYIVGVLGGEITADDYPLESTDRIVERESCVVIL